MAKTKRKRVPRPLRPLRENTARVVGLALAVTLFAFTGLDFAWSALWGVVGYVGVRFGLGVLFTKI